MSLTVGSRLGHYDVTALIGEGGMGQVYQATDTKHSYALSYQDGCVTEPSTKPGSSSSYAPATRETCNGRQGWSEGQG